VSRSPPRRFPSGILRPHWQQCSSGSRSRGKRSPLPGLPGFRFLVGSEHASEARGDVGPDNLGPIPQADSECSGTAAECRRLRCYARFRRRQRRPQRPSRTVSHGQGRRAEGGGPKVGWPPVHRDVASLDCPGRAQSSLRAILLPVPLHMVSAGISRSGPECFFCLPEDPASSNAAERQHTGATGSQL
jgi:hypothetical protein